MIPLHVGQRFGSVMNLKENLVLSLLTMMELLDGDLKLINFHISTMSPCFAGCLEFGMSFGLGICFFLVLGLRNQSSYVFSLPLFNYVV